MAVNIKDLYGNVGNRFNNTQKISKNALPLIIKGKALFFEIFCEYVVESIA